MFAPQTGEALIALLTTEHADLADPLRFARNMQDVVSDGETFTAYPFEIEFPEESADSPPQVQLAIDNVLRTITDAILDLSPAPTVRLQLALASSPDTIEAETAPMTLRDIEATAFRVTGRLTFESVLEEPYPGPTFNPVDWPGLF